MVGGEARFALREGGMLEKTWPDTREENDEKRLATHACWWCGCNYDDIVPLRCEHVWVWVWRDESELGNVTGLTVAAQKGALD